MVTYNSNLAAVQQEGFIELYQFRAGSTVDYITSWPSSVSFLGQTYASRAIKRSGFTKDTQFAAVSMTIEAVLTSRFLEYIANQPIEPISVTLYSAPESNLASYVTLFKGEILSVSAKGNHIVAQCESGSRKLKTRIPRFIAQSFCNHDVFDARCQANPYTFRVAGTASSITGRNVVVAEISGYADDWFSMGVLQFGTDCRLITKQTGTTVTLHTPFGSSFIVGSEFYLYPGCDGDPDTCQTKFNNYAHFVGAPLIPTSNPTVWGVQE